MTSPMADDEKKEAVANDLVNSSPTVFGNSRRKSLEAVIEEEREAATNFANAFKQRTSGYTTN